MRALLIGLALLATPALAGTPNYSNTTILHYGGGHGSQVEFLGANGMSYLWYPGNRVVLPAPWKQEGQSICFLYGSNTYNPVTKQGGGKWECMPITGYQRTLKEFTRGDVFGLARKKAVPFVLPKQQTTLKNLMNNGKKGYTPNKPIDYSTRLDMNKLLSSCDYVIRNQNADRLARRVASGIYFWGGLRNDSGKPNGCVAIDIKRAFDLERRNNDPESFNGLVRALKERAKDGEGAAIAALKTVDLTPPR